MNSTYGNKIRCEMMQSVQLKSTKQPRKGNERMNHLIA